MTQRAAGSSMCRQLIFLVAAACLQLAVSQDYCRNLTEIPAIDKRDTQYRLGHGEKGLNDKFLKGWYEFPKDRTFASSAPGVGFCGTEYPIWRKEKEGAISTMCVQTIGQPCRRKFTITTGMCDGREVFELKTNPVYGSAYCIGYPPGKGPPAEVASPTVNVQLNNTWWKGTLVLSCNFSKLDNDNVWYRTYWFVDEKQINVSGPTLWKDGPCQKHALDEKSLKNSGIKKVGFQVRCSVRASFEENSAQSVPSSSSSKFIGIKVLNPSLTLEEGQTTHIELQLTAPFGCGDNPDCELPINSYRLDNQGKDGDCESEMMGTDCGVLVNASRWFEPVRFEVVAQTVQVQNGATRTVQLNLRTDLFGAHRFWEDYDLGLITVQIIRKGSLIKSKKCHSVNDPHMKTFDGRLYEQHKKGTFTLYKHNDLPIEVQHQTTDCIYYKTAKCNCGVAIRAGRTVFEINKCGGRPVWYINYSLCKDKGELLRVKKHGATYEIYLPTGGKVKVLIKDNLLNVEIYPSVQDYKKSGGLCGYLSDDCTDDFIMQDGSYSTDKTSRSACGKDSKSHMGKFAESWRVSDYENLFNHNNFGDDFPSAWTHAATFCTCPNGDGRGYVNKVVCIPTMPYKICNTLPGYKTVPSTCTISSKRRKRFIASWTQETGRFKRQSEQSWTEETARTYCESAFENSTTVRICRNVTEHEAIDSLDNCGLDIMLSGTTDFTSTAIDSLRSKCQEEVLVNPDFHKKDPSKNQKSVMDEIIADTCPNDCSHLGVCAQGMCKCRDSYGGTDCSVDLRAPPRLDWAGDQGHCDTSEENCDVLSVYGETFVDEATCHVEQIKVYESRSEVFDRRTVETVVASISEAQCRVGSTEPMTSSDEDFITAYRLSVSNQGDGFPSGVPVMVYDGRCIEADVTATEFKWEIKGLYCHYKGKCVPSKGNHPKNDCLICEVSGDDRRWKMKNDAGCQLPPKPKNDVPVGPVIGGTVTVMVIVAIAVTVIYVRKRK